MFSLVLITPDIIIFCQRKVLPTTRGWALGLSAGWCGFRWVVLFGSYELLGKDLLDKEGLEDCILGDVQHGSVCGP